MRPAAELKDFVRAARALLGRERDLAEFEVYCASAEHRVARLAHTSRTRVTAILNRNTHDISTDLMLRVLGSLGVQAKLQFRNAA